MQIFLYQSIFALFESHINYPWIIWDKTAQLTISTFFQKRHLELSILQSVIFTLLNFINLKFSKIPDRVKLEKCLFIHNILLINYLIFLLLGLLFHQCFTITKHHLPLKEIFKSLVSKEDHMEKMFLSMCL